MRNVDWTRVVTHPLGLVAFVVALIFAAAGVHLGSRGRRPRSRWVLVFALSSAVLVAAGGLYLAYAQLVGPSSTTAAREAHNAVTQTTSGDMSPAIQGVGGNVELNQTGTPP